MRGLRKRRALRWRDLTGQDLPVVINREENRVSVMHDPMPELECFRCHRKPREIEEYIEAGAENAMTPEDFVWAEEGTLNKTNGHFACTSCYIREGMPTGGPGGHWVAP